jgi:hypothetical protein
VNIDDILIAYKNNLTNIHDIINCFYNTVPTVQFNIEKKTENKIKFLDITICRDNSTRQYAIFDIYI